MRCELRLDAFQVLHLFIFSKYFADFFFEKHFFKSSLRGGGVLSAFCFQYFNFKFFSCICPLRRGTFQVFDFFKIFCKVLFSKNISSKVPSGGGILLFEVCFQYFRFRFFLYLPTTAWHVSSFSLLQNILQDFVFEKHFFKSSLRWGIWLFEVCFQYFNFRLFSCICPLRRGTLQAFHFFKIF